jgi:hypothetical protein
MLFNGVIRNNKSRVGMVLIGVIRNSWGILE